MLLMFRFKSFQYLSMLPDHAGTLWSEVFSSERCLLRMVHDLRRLLIATFLYGVMEMPMFRVTDQIPHKPTLTWEKAQSWSLPVVIARECCCACRLLGRAATGRPTEALEWNRSSGQNLWMEQWCPVGKGQGRAVFPFFWGVRISHHSGPWPKLLTCIQLLVKQICHYDGSSTPNQTGKVSTYIKFLYVSGYLTSQNQRLKRCDAPMCQGALSLKD